MIRLAATTVLAAGAALVAADGRCSPVWPPPPDEPRVAYESAIDIEALRPEAGWLHRIARWIGGGTADETLHLPFDVVVQGDVLWMTCQNLDAVVRVQPADGTYRLYRCEELPFVQPIALSATEDAVWVTDSGAAAVYRIADGRVEPRIRNGLARPTGIATVTGEDRLYVVDTGAHVIRVYDLNGTPVDTLEGRAEADEGLNFPTFATSRGRDVWINDTLNYRIKRYDGGELRSAFGGEGDGPGAFARPKGLAVDRDGHVYVADALFDNVQIFDSRGNILLVLGSRGQEPGQFWSPGGVDIHEDRIYVADTFNDRVQVLRYLGE